MMPRAFTLVEVLAVIVIMAIIAASLAASLGGASDQAQFMQVLADLRDLDARGRMFARTSEGAAELAIDADARRIRLSGAGSDDVVAQRSWPGGVSVTFSADRPVTSVIFDRAGRSIDYSVRITADSSRATLRFCGLTGWATTEDSP